MNQQYPTISPVPPPSKEWAWKETLTLVFLVLVPLVGIILMWLISNWSKKAKVIITLAVGPITTLFIGVGVWSFINLQSSYNQLRELSSGIKQEEKLSAEEYIQKAEVEILEVKRFLKEDQAFEVQKHSAQALEYGTRATDLEPDNSEIWFRRGNLYYELKDIALGAGEWALKCYQKALELDPDNSLYRQKVEELTK